jgi:hypothetical protein
MSFFTIFETKKGRNMKSTGDVVESLFFYFVMLFKTKKLYFTNPLTLYVIVCH